MTVKMKKRQLSQKLQKVHTSHSQTLLRIRLIWEPGTLGRLKFNPWWSVLVCVLNYSQSYDTGKCLGTTGLTNGERVLKLREGLLVSGPPKGMQIHMDINNR